MLPMLSDPDRDRDREHCPVCGGLLGAPLLCSPDRLHGTPGAFSVARCGGCGLGVTLPPVAPAQLAAFYPGTYGAYGFPSGLLGLVSAAIRRLQCSHALRTPPLAGLAQMPAGRLLDVGCGRGDLGTWFVRRGWSAVGVEPSPEACALARARGVDTRVGTLAEARLEPGSFDAVVFRQSLEHVSDPLEDLRRAHAALHEGGVLVVSVPNFACWQRRRFGGSWFHLDLPRHRFHFDPTTLRLTLQRAGFADIETLTTSSTAGLPASIQYLLAGRCLFPGGLRLRAAAAACTLALPLTWALAEIAGGGDVLHAVARKPPAPTTGAAPERVEAAPEQFASAGGRPAEALPALSETGRETVSTPAPAPTRAGRHTA
jgi:SAM-dependent methyltransferase